MNQLPSERIQEILSEMSAQQRARLEKLNAEMQGSHLVMNGPTLQDAILVYLDEEYEKKQVPSEGGGAGGRPIKLQLVCDGCGREVYYTSNIGLCNICSAHRGGGTAGKTRYFNEE
jgi:hypothetical protein